MTPRAAAIVYAGLSLIVACFQAALVLGAPWGALTWGGRFVGVLPGSMRAAAALSMFLMLAFAWMLLSRAHVVRHRPAARPLAWVVVVYSVIGVLANAATPSAWERIIWLPIVSLMLLCSLIVARARTR